MIHWVAMRHDLDPSRRTVDLVATQTLIYALHGVIPCHKCADDFRKWVFNRKFETALHARRLFAWSVHFHNHVNGAYKQHLSVREARDLTLGGLHGPGPADGRDGRELMVSVVVLAVGFTISIAFWTLVKKTVSGMNYAIKSLFLQ